MATGPVAAAECARKILHVFAEYGSQPGDVLYDEVLMGAAEAEGWAAALEDGIDYGMERRWYDPAPRGGVRLSPAGYSKLQSPN